jgi:hypothetical protein
METAKNAANKTGFNARLLVFPAARNDGQIFTFYPDQVNATDRGLPGWGQLTPGPHDVTKATIARKPLLVTALAIQQTFAGSDRC